MIPPIIKENINKNTSWTSKAAAKITETFDFSGYSIIVALNKCHSNLHSRPVFNLTIPSLTKYID